ncbi:NADH-quinone oxidoreductase subunit [Dirofilaria immitis]
MMQSFHPISDVEANKSNAPLAGQNHTWFHLIVSIHAISALSLCIFTVLGYVANTIPMALVVLFIFQTFMAILGLTAIEQNRRDYRSLYIAINAVTAGSAIIWSIFLFINIKQQPKYVPVVLLIIAFFSLIATILLIICADKKTPKFLEKIICLDIISVFPFVKLLRGTNKITKTTNLKNTQLGKTKEVNSNESLNGSIESVKSQEQRKDSSEIKTGASVTESLEQRQGISETKSEEGNKELRIAAGAEDASKVITAVETIRVEEISGETKNTTALSYMKHLSEGHYLVVDSNWHEFYSVPILNACNVALCSSSRTGGHLRNKFLIKKCRKKQKKLRKIIPKFSPLEMNIFDCYSQNNEDNNFEKNQLVKNDHLKGKPSP